jgi:hypothetical protein
MHANNVIGDAHAREGSYMRIRKNVRSLTAEERRALVDALLILKRRNRYDQYVHWHHHGH